MVVKFAAQLGSLSVNHPTLVWKYICQPFEMRAAKLTTLLSHSALRWSNTTALQQLPVGDHGGRMNTQIKGFAKGERRLSARLKKWEALRPQTSARPSSLDSAGGEKTGRAVITCRNNYWKFIFFFFNGIQTLLNQHTAMIDVRCAITEPTNICKRANI